MTAFAWLNAPLICGQCHFLMHCEASRNVFPVEYRAECQNSKCTNFGKLFRVDPACAIKLTEISNTVANFKKAATSL